MKRGGYDSYGPDEVLKRARARGEDVSRDRLFRTAGAVANGFWLLVLAVLTLAAAWLGVGALLPGDILTLALTVTVVAALIAPPIAGWLVAPYAESIFRRLLWGLSATALLLLMVHSALMVALLGRPSSHPDVGGAFVMAGLFTLAIALPMSVLYLIWGWLRRRSLPQDRTARLWRRALPIALVLGMAILLYREWAYISSLKFTS
jgi:hypothetical protein